MNHKTPLRLEAGERIYIMDAYYFATTHIIQVWGANDGQNATLCGFEPSDLMLATARACYVNTELEVNYGMGEATPVKFLANCIHCRHAYVKAVEVSQPNLTERLNAIVGLAFLKLSAANGSVRYKTHIRAKAAIHGLAYMASEASERIHYAELRGPWCGWFIRQARHARFRFDISEAHRLDKLQYNGRSPF